MRFTNKIEALAAAFPLSITSWYRSTSRNKKVGGTETSFHLLGLAVDVVLDSEKDKHQFLALAKRLKLWTLDERDHVHVQEVI